MDYTITRRETPAGETITLDGLDKTLGRKGPHRVESIQAGLVWPGINPGYCIVAARMMSGHIVLLHEAEHQRVENLAPALTGAASALKLGQIWHGGSPADVAYVNRVYELWEDGGVTGPPANRLYFSANPHAGLPAYGAGMAAGLIEARPRKLFIMPGCKLLAEALHHVKALPVREVVERLNEHSVYLALVHLACGLDSEPLDARPQAAQHQAPADAVTGI